ncbi:MAG: PIN domain-containing protein [Pararhizobium sp.]
MGADVFLDTNILLYAALGREHAQSRFAAARRIVLEEDYCTSAQVLAEFFVNAQKSKGARRPLDRAKAFEWVRIIAKKPCQPVDARLVAEGIAHASRYEISYWDGAIIAAAERLGASILYTEDLNHDQNYGTVRVVNPFLEM